MASLMSEVGELAEEVNIQTGHCGKLPGKDGIIGEAVDVIICALDMIRVNYPEATEDDIRAIAQNKCDKWLFMWNKWHNK